MLQHFVDSYNASYHRSVGMSPVEVNVVYQEEVWQRLYGNERASTVEPGLKVDDRVRISKAKRQFKKSYLPNWSDELFTVKSVHRTDTPVCRMVADQGSRIEGTFYEQELQKVVITVDKVYRIEKVLQQRNRRRKTQFLVNWLGYPESFNSWMDKSSLVAYKGWRTSLVRPPILAMDVTTVVVHLEDTVEDTGSTSKRWVLFGSSCPKAEIALFCQVVVLYIVIVVSIYNLTTTDANSNMWTALLSSCLGYLLPNPTLKHHVVWLLLDVTQQRIRRHIPPQHVDPLYHDFATTLSGQWECGLVEVQYPVSCYYVRKRIRGGSFREQTLTAFQPSVI